MNFRAIGGLVAGLACFVVAAPGWAITNGMSVPNGSYPFLASVKIDGDSTNHTCAGTLIAPRLVLTYPVCLAGIQGSEVPAGNITVTVGRTVLSDASQGQVRRVAKVHSELSNGGNGHVTVLELASPINGIEPVSLVAAGSDEFQRPGQELSFVGWGGTTLSGPLSDRLQVARMNVNNGPCESATSLPALCATGQNGARIACFGDAGGPLFTDDPSQRRRFIQVGMMREGWGIRCEDRQSFETFGKLNDPEVANYLAALIARIP
jgi:secreted trypsin-like serine protease